MTKLQEIVNRMLRDNWINADDEQETIQLRKDLLPYIREAYTLGREVERKATVKRRRRERTR